jgi:YD repeat-containing protein
VIEQIRSGGSVSKQEYDEAKRLKARFMSDREWARRCFDGGMKERQQMSLVSIILSSPIAEGK